MLLLVRRTAWSVTHPTNRMAQIDRPSRHTGVVVRPGGERSTVIATAVPLVGREEERAVLRAALAFVGPSRPGPSESAAATGRHVALLGAAGAGKSRLARELALAAEAAGVRTLAGRAVPGAGPTPYRALREAMLAWTRDGSPVAGQDRYADALAPLLGPGPAADPPSGQVSPVFVGEALLRTLTAAPAGVVLVLEDLHWADNETVSAVEYLCDNAPAARLLVVLTCRDEEPSAARDLVRRLVARGAATAVPLGALSEHQTAVLAASLFGAPVSPELATSLHHRSDGVPLLVEELVAALRTSGRATTVDGTVTAELDGAAVLPASVADTVQARLGTLGADEQRILQTAAVLGRTVDPGRLERVAGSAAPDVISALRDATALALLEEDPDTPGALRFRHALVRDAVEASAFPPERVLVAGRALEVVMDGGEPESLADDDLPLAFDLSARSGDRPLATRLALRAAAVAWDSWALSTAESWLARARRFADTEDEVAAIDLENIRVSATVGRVDVVARLARGLLVRSSLLSGHDELESRMRLAQVLLDDEQLDEGIDQLGEARPLVDSLDDPCMRTRHDLYSSVAALGLGDRDRATALARSAIALAEPFDDQRDLVCAGLLQLGRALLPDVDAARAAWTRSLALTEQYGYRLWRARMLAELATLSVPELSGAEELDIAALGAREAGAVELSQRVELLRAELGLLTGRLDEAEDRIARADLTAPDTTVAAATRRKADELRALVTAMRGGPAADDEARRLSPDAWHLVRATRALATDDTTSGEQLEQPVTTSAVQLGPALAAVGAVANPGHAASRCAALAGGSVGRAAAQAHAALRARAADPAAAAREVVDAAEQLRGAPWFAAVLTRTCAPELVALGAGEPLREPLREAAATFDGLGLSVAADACRALLRQAGVPVPRRGTLQDGVPDRLASFGVTAREMDVLRLVAEGLTSREIGERLYLSPRTVEKHVERLLVKTGAVNRAALAALVGTPQVT